MRTGSPPGIAGALVAVAREAGVVGALPATGIGKMLVASDDGKGPGMDVCATSVSVSDLVRSPAGPCRAKRFAGGDRTLSDGIVVKGTARDPTMGISEAKLIGKPDVALEGTSRVGAAEPVGMARVVVDATNGTSACGTFGPVALPCVTIGWAAVTVGAAGLVRRAARDRGGTCDAGRAVSAPAASGISAST
ncbi:hypothetical protein VH567_06740 [Sphingomonas sp. 4RDLI-65]|uniref:hypothetical protein n=1 Tax=Sphingomonas sp. 4RDLI-65 TaxID=3111641 RepID=UPI003C19721A